MLLRPGGASAAKIEAILQRKFAVPNPKSTISAPGQLTSHYAPTAFVRLDVKMPKANEIWVGFGPKCSGSALNLSPKADLVEAAANLFHMMREADILAQGEALIAFAPIPNVGLGRAINDRLGRSAAPRPQG
jgi:L-threonylcarbamoyladenylate synthase